MTGRLRRRPRPRPERRKLRRPETTGALVAWSTRYMLLGAFDVVLVVIAAEYIDLGQAGAGILSTMVGLGSIASIGVASRLARARRLGPRIMVALAVVAVSVGGFGLSVEPAVAIVALIVCGFALSVVDLLARVLLQRSAPPSELGHLFGVVEVVNGVGLVVGALAAKFTIAASGPRLALWTMATLTGAAAVFAWRGLRRIDAVATMPVVDMSLLTRYPVFATLPPPQLELLARSAERQPMAEGDVVIREGEEGRTFFAVCTGTFDVTMSGRSVRRLGRGDGFGEIALLARVPRTATVTTVESGELLVVDRDAFLLAVTGHAPTHDAVWEQVARLEHDRPLPPKPVHPLHLPPESAADGQPTPP